MTFEERLNKALKEGIRGYRMGDSDPEGFDPEGAGYSDVEFWADRFDYGDEHKCGYCSGGPVEPVLFGEDEYYVCANCKGTDREETIKKRVLYNFHRDRVGSICKTHGLIMPDCEGRDARPCVPQTVDDVHPISNRHGELN